MTSIKQIIERKAKRYMESNHDLKMYALNEIQQAYADGANFALGLDMGKVAEFLNDMGYHPHESSTVESFAANFGIECVSGVWCKK